VRVEHRENTREGEAQREQVGAGRVDREEESW
jgi:hypothetical protein